MRSAVAPVAQAFETFEGAVALCDTAKGDDVPELLGEWAQAWGTFGRALALEPTHSLAEPGKRRIVRPRPVRMGDA